MAKNYTTGIIITGDAKGGIKAIEATEKNLTKFNKTAKNSGSALSKVGKVFDSAIGNVAAYSAAVTAAGIAGTAFIIHNASQIKQQAMLADAIGVSTNKLNGLSYAARDTIITQEKLGDILKDTSEKIGDYLVTGGGEAADVIKRLNLDVNELAGLSPDKQLLKIAEGLDQVGSKSEKIAILESMASDASLLLPLLENNAEGLRAAQREADALGVSLSDIDTSMIAQASSDVGRLGSAFSGAGNILTAQLAPAFGAVSGAIVDTVVQQDLLRDSTTDLSDVSFSAVSTIVDNVRDASDAFEALAYKVGLVYAILNTEVSLSTFDDIGKLFDGYTEKVNEIYKQNEEFKAGYRKNFSERIEAYKLEADYQKQLNELGFNQNEIIGQSPALIKAKTDALKAEKKEWDSILDSALNTAEATQQAMEDAWATRSENKYQNGLDAQWNTDNNNFDKLDEQDAILAQTLEMATAVDDYGDAWTRTGDKALDAMGSMLNVIDKVGANDKKYADQMQVMRQAGLSQTEEFIKLEKARAKNSIKGSMSMLDASVAMFEEGSAAQEAAHKASLVFHAVEMAMDMEKAISAATIAVAEQGKGDPYTAWARIGAMSVMMAGVLSQIGATFGGASGSSSASYAYVPDNGSGVLGGGDSNALQNFNDRLMDVNAEQYNELRAINQNTKFLNQAMVSASSALYSTGTISGLSVDLSSFQKSGAVSLIDDMTSMISDIPVLGLVGGAIGGLVSNIIGAVFGGGTSRTSVGYGLNVGGALGSVGVGGYQTIKKKTDGGWLGKTKTSYYDINRAVDPQVGEAINSTFNYLGDTLVNFGDLLERDVSDLVGDLRVTTGKINLTGKNSGQVQEALTNAINIQSDKWAYELFGEVINQYQKIEESAFDTLSRLVIDKTVVEDVLKTTGQTVVGDALDLSQALISVSGSLESLTDSASTYYDAFYSDAEKQARLTEQLTGALAGVNLALPDARDGYRALVESMDLSTDAGQSAYVTLLSLSDSADKYYSELESLQTDYFDTQINLIKTTIDAYSGLKNALQSTYNSIMGIGSANSMDYISAQTVLSDAVINARSGSLPELANIQDALGVVSSNSASNYASYTDYQRDQMVTANMVDELIGYTDGALTVQDSMLNELEAQTALLSGIAVVSGVDGSHATGLASVPFDGYTAELHKGEAVIDARTMQGLRKYGVNSSSNDGALIQEVKALRNQVIQMQDVLHSGNLANATNTLKMSKLMDKWDIDGQPEVRQ